MHHERFGPADDREVLDPPFFRNEWSTCFLKMKKSTV
ncbi:hypothetical protein Mpal_2414 [Methanosphaerula palustris E1-9c]|uniref:Uncharacterized protein n=1 Tax=Methanosphaerula palustris (strain ATCC BAA-1556 / DSM 19958 / E1-9c) TaxID=521011 RepID=B8GEJ3_METPE|nr:hypothetical protein Mpal_2414 [Methanosphaerula palustris E1-9c]